MRHPKFREETHIVERARVVPRRKHLVAGLMVALVVVFRLEPLRSLAIRAHALPDRSMTTRGRRSSRRENGRNGRSTPRSGSGSGPTILACSPASVEASAPSVERSDPATRCLDSVPPC